MTDETTAVEKQSVEKQIEKQSSKGAAIGVLFSTVIILIVAAGSGVGYLHMSNVNNGLSGMVTTLKQQTDGYQQRIDELQQSIAGLQETLKKSQDLSTQQEKIISDWRATQQADVTPVYLQLNALNQQIDQLPLPQSPIKLDEIPNPIPAPGNVSADLPWWKAGMEYSKQALKKIVVVRNTGTTAAPLIFPEEKMFLYQNLHAQLENAMWAVLHHNQDVYKTSLTRATAWITQYFAQEAPETKAVLTRLNELQQVDVKAAAVAAEAAEAATIPATIAAPATTQSTTADISTPATTQSTTPATTQSTTPATPAETTNTNDQATVVQ